MSCTCQTDPCSCACSCSSNPCCCQQVARPPCTLCDGDRRNNVWVEGLVDENGVGGICLLDTLTEAQIIGVLEVDEVARADLRRVTTNPHLLNLADTVPRLSTVEESDRLQTQWNRHADSIPFYSIFRGQPPFAQ